MGSVLGADGDAGDVLTVCGLKVSELDKERRPFGNYRTIWMDGQLVYKFAVKTMVSSTIEVVENAGYTIDDIDLVENPDTGYYTLVCSGTYSFIDSNGYLYTWGYSGESESDISL